MRSDCHNDWAEGSGPGEVRRWLVGEAVACRGCGPRWPSVRPLVLARSPVARFYRSWLADRGGPMWFNNGVTASGTRRRLERADLLCACAVPTSRLRRNRNERLRVANRAEPPPPPIIQIFEGEPIDLTVTRVNLGKFH